MEPPEAPPALRRQLLAGPCPPAGPEKTDALASRHVLEGVSDH
jgi:hypothetical protein